MSFSEIMSISKLPGLYQMHKKRTDGLIVKSLTDDKILFAASRSHVFTPLENITIYTADEPIELMKVFLMIREYASKYTLPSAKDSNENLKSFFGKVVPSYDQDRVYISDIQKIVKWYSILEDQKLLESPEPNVEANTSKKEDSADTAPAPKPKKEPKKTSSSEKVEPKAKKTTKKTKE